MKIAIVGCGTMGQTFARIVGAMPNAELVGIYNHSPHTAKAFAESLGTKWYSSYDELLATKQLELVIITLPTYLHKAYTIRAAAYGKHIICEKPIALNPKDAEEMLHACDRAGVRLFVGHVLRFFPEYMHARKQITEGAIGTIGIVRAKRASLHPPANSWFADSGKSGGVIFDLMIHEIDFIRSLLGEVRSVYAAGKRAAGFEYAAVTMRFENGAIANAEAVWGHPASFHSKLDIFGTDGVLRCDSQSSRPLVLHRSDSGSAAEAEGVVLPEAPSRQDPFALEIEHFIDCIRNRKEPVVTAADACEAVAVARMASESIETGKPVYKTHEADRRADG
ncbi:Gfo/Idh/MocA family protein [Paenibacillus sp. GYB003]|uniref:Gfo/Idh/MocA family protein n=1 Tax=Paenibacillus sp. GYB003 TaxID=2994392 RepID=UPI002F9638E2